MYLFLNPRIISEEGTVYRFEKCGSRNERELVMRPYRVVVDGDYILRAVLDPLDLKIRLKRLEKPSSSQDQVPMALPMRWSTLRVMNRGAPPSGNLSTR